MSDREEQFEKMLSFVEESYHETVQKMEKLKSEDKTKTAAYRELMGKKLTYQNVLDIYKLFGLI